MLNKIADNSSIVGAVFLVAVVLFGVRWSTDILDKGPTYDEKYITLPMQNIIQKGWSVQTAIDFEETKGPALIWPYAFIGKLFGGTLNDLRLVSLWCSIFGLAILSWIAVRSSLYRGSIFLVAVGWLLLPYNLVFSELVMGEISFLLLSLLAVAAFIWGIEKNSPKSRQFVAPLLYGVVLAFALHSRIHVVALAGGICFTAFALQGKQSWPWWVASILAGLLRIPLWMRWGGLVSPEYQSLHGLGFRLESLSYLAAALVPFVGVFAIQGWRVAKSKVGLVLAFAVGVALIYIAMPTLHIPESIDYVNQNERFQGISGSIATIMTSSASLSQAILALLAGIGLAGLVGVWHCRERARVVSTITFWSITIGWLLYAFTRGFVFDRFLLTWAFLLPIVWVRVLPKWLLAVQYLVLFAIAAYLTATWL